MKEFFLALFCTLIILGCSKDCKVIERADGFVEFQCTTSKLSGITEKFDYIIPKEHENKLICIEKSYEDNIVIETYYYNDVRKKIQRDIVLDLIINEMEDKIDRRFDGNYSQKYCMNKYTNMRNNYNIVKQENISNPATIVVKAEMSNDKETISRSIKLDNKEMSVDSNVTNAVSSSVGVMINDMIKTK